MTPDKLEAAIAASRDRAITVAANILGSDDADDAVQDASLRAWKYIDSFDPYKSTFWAWYSRIVVNCAFVILKRNSNSRSTIPLDSIGDTQMADPEESPDNKTLHRIATERCKDALEWALRCLTPRDADMVRSFYIDGKDIEAVAKAGGVDIGAARMRLSRSLRVMRPALSEALSK